MAQQPKCQQDIRLKGQETPELGGIHHSQIRNKQSPCHHLTAQPCYMHQPHSRRLRSCVVIRKQMVGAGTPLCSTLHHSQLISTTQQPNPINHITVTPDWHIPAIQQPTQWNTIAKWALTCSGWWPCCWTDAQRMRYKDSAMLVTLSHCPGLVMLDTLACQHILWVSSSSISQQTGPADEASSSAGQRF